MWVSHTSGFILIYLPHPNLESEAEFSKIKWDLTWDFCGDWGLGLEFWSCWTSYRELTRSQEAGSNGKTKRRGKTKMRLKQSQGRSQGVCGLEHKTSTSWKAGQELYSAFQTYHWEKQNQSGLSRPERTNMAPSKQCPWMMLPQV